MSKYVPVGPFQVSRKGGMVDRDNIGDFWQRVDEYCPGLSDAVGCYIFGIRAGRGVRPWYVGKTERASFRKEVFTPHKLVLYGEALNEVRKGTAMLYFIAKSTPTGKFRRPTSGNVPAIGALEELLIGTALQKNPNLLNKRTTKHLREIEVPGYMNEKRGPRTKSAKALADVLGARKNEKSRKGALAA